MSSLAASRADGFYFPPEYLDNEVNKKMGLSKYQGSKGANQYQQHGVIRFELPFDAWCLKCSRHMSKGLRFNAKKDKCGNYFSTIIFSFTTKCPSCDNVFVIKTDPQNNTYDYAEGLRKQELDYEPEFGDGIIESTGTETKKKLAEDPIFKLQHDKEDRERALTVKTRLTNLLDLSDQVNKPDYDRNAALRNSNRSHRKRQQELIDQGAAIGLPIPLVETSEIDACTARTIAFRSTTGSNSRFSINQRLKMVDIKSQSIFGENADQKHILSSKRRKKSENNIISSSASRKNEQMKQALCKQAVHKISMKDVKLNITATSTPIMSCSIKKKKKPKLGTQDVEGTSEGANNDINSGNSVSASLLSSSSTTRRIHKHDMSVCDGNTDCGGALSMLGGLYNDSDDDGDDCQ